jgi:hypothetical protein
MSVIILHIHKQNYKNNINELELLMCLSSKYLEYVPIGGKIYNKLQCDIYDNIFKNALRESREETMNCINEKFIKKISENDDCIKYLCKNQYNNTSVYILFKNSLQLQFSNKSKTIYVVLHLINDIETIQSIEKLKEIRKFTIQSIKKNNVDKMLELSCDYKTEYNVIEKINEMYIFEKKENKDIKKLYISPYLETIELKWITFEYLMNNSIDLKTNDRLYENKNLYNTIFYKNWDILYKKIISKKIDEYWLSQYLQGKDIENNIIINYHYKNLIIDFIKNNINYFEK